MIDYRTPPSPLPSKRDFMQEALDASLVEPMPGARKWALRADLSCRTDRGLLAIHLKKSVSRRYPLVASVIEDALAQDEVFRRARRVPAPKGTRS